MSHTQNKDQHFEIQPDAPADEQESASKEPSRSAPFPDEHSVPPARRSFLGLVIGLIGASITGVLGVVFAGFSLFPAFRKTSASAAWVDVVPIDEIPDGEPVKKAVVIAQDVGWGRFNSQQLVWIMKNGERLVVYSAICPHLGCTINVAEDGFICPCHGSAWNRDGNRLGGPTPRGMDTIQYQVEDGMLRVNYQFFRQGVPDKQAIT